MHVDYQLENISSDFLKGRTKHDLTFGQFYLETDSKKKKKKKQKNVTTLFISILGVLVKGIYLQCIAISEFWKLK